MIFSLKSGTFSALLGIVMRAHALIHVEAEGLGTIEDFLLSRGHGLRFTKFHRGDEVPALEAFDWLIVMGGPMSVHDKAKHPWLADETALIKSAVEAGKLVLGVCLGSQLIAHALGAIVKPNDEKEIGWFSITPADSAKNTRFAKAFSQEIEVFHWHGETFDLPVGSALLASSEACKNQGFAIGDRVVGLQFHAEITPDGAYAFIQAGKDEIITAKYVQNEGAMLANSERFKTANQLLHRVLLDLEEQGCA